MQKSVKALTKGKEICSCYEYWIIITWLSLILLGVVFLIIEKAHKMPIFRKHQYSNTIKVLIFISNIKSYDLLHFLINRTIFVKRDKSSTGSPVFIRS